MASAMFTVANSPLWKEASQVSLWKTCGQKINANCFLVDLII
jgi:hypothetical protein